MARKMKVGARTPWGKAQTVRDIGSGMTLVSTASHGGIRVPPVLNRLIPDYMRVKSGWYEEDCAWCIPVIVIWNNKLGQILLDEDYRIEAEKTFRNWYPHEYETFFQVVLAPGESHEKDHDVFMETHAKDWVAIAAWGDWEEGVPKKMVKVETTEGGRRHGYIVGNESRCYLVPEEEYKVKQCGESVIDETRHQRMS